MRITEIPDSERRWGATDMKSVIEASLDDDKAEDIISIDLSGKTDIADYMIIASGRSQRHVSAIAQHLVERLRKETGQTVSVEGGNQADWVLVDAADVIVHVFRPEVRSFYNLEKMWAVPLPAEAEQAVG